MRERRTKILLPSDGSDQAFDAIRYVAAFFPPPRTAVGLFHVDTGVPEALLDREKDPGFRAHNLPLGRWALEARKQTEEALERGRQILMDAGFPPGAVSLKVQTRKRGVARDILDEAHQGYDAVVVGRCGISNVKGVVVGSVAHKLVTQIDPLPIGVVGGSPEATKVLVGFDGSQGSMRAVDWVCSGMHKEGREVTLCFVVRSLGAHLGSGTIFKPEHEKAWIEASRQEMESAFEDAENRLVDAGFHPGHLFVRVLENHTSRAMGIAAVMRDAFCGTIVVGRQGLSKVQEFSIGRVGRKVLQLAEDRAVWIV